MSPDHDAIARVQQRMLGRKARSAGADAEIVVGHRLRALGFACVEQIATPKAVNRRGKMLHLAKVSGDWKAVEPGTGRAVLVESKWRPDRLCFSDLEPHQVAALNEHHHAGGLALVAWTNPNGCFLLEWPIGGFVAGRSLLPERATALHFTR